MLTARTADNSKVLEYFQKAKAWVNLFTSLGGKAEGYKKTNVTPYMHSMVYHAPFFMSKHSGLSKFTGQGVEKKNDDCRRIHLFKSNKWDAAKDVLLVSKRLENLQDYERKPREYIKKNAEYWDTTIKEKRSLLRKSIQTPDEHNQEQDAVAEMSPPEIRAKLKKMGYPTKVRNAKRLQELYQIAIQSAAQR
ncbi:uncharacterized protein LOC114518738 [Dendronephthya gigantea]|uniref:uncharacterized protein LOC114518738 n=1 Tax=Dendronephthya gigantea TaxID=151771 RepID=UPI0010692323|nr:uncharacterized protein LOC114518738 [Dendronephthya gigantea]